MSKHFHSWNNTIIRKCLVLSITLILSSCCLSNLVIWEYFCIIFLIKLSPLMHHYWQRALIISLDVFLNLKWDTFFLFSNIWWYIKCLCWLFIRRNIKIIMGCSNVFTWNCLQTIWLLSYKCHNLLCYKKTFMVFQPVFNTLFLRGEGGGYPFNFIHYWPSAQFSKSLVKCFFNSFHLPFTKTGNPWNAYKHYIMKDNDHSRISHNL